MQATIKHEIQNNRITVTDAMHTHSDLGYYEMRYPQVRVIDFAKGQVTNSSRFHLGSYCILISPLDNLQGTMSIIAPGKVIYERTKTLLCKPKTQALVFHPDLLHNPVAGIPEGAFLDYNADQSLVLSPVEYQFALNCFSNIQTELDHCRDKHSKRLIVSNIQLFLSYCERFYSRQLITTAVNKNHDVLQRFNILLSRYFSSENPYQLGIPSVAYCAEKLNLSANYFGSLIKKETGKTAQDYIRDTLVEKAKYRIINTHKTINEIAYEFGFKYPQHFSRFFRRVVGQNPNQYRNLNLN